MQTTETINALDGNDVIVAHPFREDNTDWLYTPAQLEQMNDDFLTAIRGFKSHEITPDLCDRIAERVKTQFDTSLNA